MKQNSVFVINSNKEPLMPCTPVRARKMLTSGKAAVFRRYPFTIILKNYRENAKLQLVSLSYDPGSKITGIAIKAQKVNGLERLCFAAELEHRGQRIKQALETRRAIRRSRRNRKTRYRKPRYLNRTRPIGWLPPSLLSRVSNILTWTKRFLKYCPIQLIVIEHVKFNTLKLRNKPDQLLNTIEGYNAREFILDTYNHTCQYCKGLTGDSKLEIDHWIPRSKGGVNHYTNYILSCRTCNREKSNLYPKEWIAKLRLSKTKLDVIRKINIMKIKTKGDKINHTFRDLATVNATRKKIVEVHYTLGVVIKLGYGYTTKYHRHLVNLPKKHWIDALCVDHVPLISDLDPDHQIFQIKAMGHGTRQRCRVNRYGFPRTGPKTSNNPVYFGFSTGDIADVDIPSGKKAGRYKGRVAVRSNGFFDVKTVNGLVSGLNYRYFKRIHCKDGYGY